MSVILVLDTNVVIDATFHRNQYSQRVLDALYKGNIQLATSDTISYEVMGVVMHHAITAGLSISQAKKPLSKLFMMYQRALHVTPKVTLQVAVHADDNKFFECAYEADIPIIISLDAHVNGTEPVETCNGRIIQVLSPWQFIQQHRITG